MSNIVLNALTYVGDGIQNGVSRWTNRLAGMAAYFKNLTVSVRTGKDARSVIKWKLVHPFPDSAPTDCPCDGQLPYQDTIVNVEFRFDPRTDTAYRTAVRLAVKDLLATSQMTDSVDNLNLPT